MRLLNTFHTLCAILFLTGCASEMSELPDQKEEYARLVLSVGIDAHNGEQAADAPRSWFDDFDNEDDKWGKQGENMEELRIVILDGSGNVEYNRLYNLSNDVETTQYEFIVRKNDTKTIVFLSNEGEYVIDGESMPDGNVHPLKEYMEQFERNSMMDIEALRKIIITLKQNSLDGKGLSLKTPLPISAIYNEHIGETEVTERTYNLHRAAVKYSFRIINNSNSEHHLERVRINRIADQEYLFPNAEYEKNELGHQIIKSYSIPSTTKEQEYESRELSLVLHAKMEKAVQAMEPVYVPEGSPGNESPQQVSISLDGAPLEIWRDLKWHMPGEDEAKERPMVDLPRNSHVVVNIIINDHGMEFVADVQPYAEVVLEPPFGLDRDDDGNIITQRYPDGTYDVMIDGNKVRKDEDGDEVLKIFTDKSLLCMTKVLKDYIHDTDDVDYTYYFEKDKSGGNMVIIRQITTGGIYHGGYDDLMASSHDHLENDRPLFVLDKKGDFYKVYYDDNDEPSLSNTDDDGALIIQANGFQFRDVDSMHKYIGTYIVRKTDGKEELRHYQTGEALDWETGIPQTGNAPLRKTKGQSNITIIRENMRKGNIIPLRVLNN